MLFWQYPNDVQILDPQEPFGIFPETEMLRCCLVRTLYSYDGKPTEQGGAQPRPDLATGAPAVSEDGLTWTFQIRRGLHYGPPLQDVEITTPDIVRALERAADPSIAAAFPPAYANVRRREHPFDFDLGMIQGFRGYEQGSAAQISGLETPDPYTLVVHLDGVTNDLIYRFGLPVTAPIPPNPSDPSARYGVAQGHDRDYGRFLVSSGPYMIDGAASLDFSAPPVDQRPLSGIDPQGITLVRNPSWDRSTDDLHGDHVDAMRFRGVPSTAKADAEIEAGTLDVIFDGTNASAVQRRFARDPSLGDRVFASGSPPVTFLSMNLAMPPFDDIHVRKAMNEAIDTTPGVHLASDQPLFGDYFFPILPYSHVAPDSAEGGLLRDYVPYPFDPAAARRQMAQATRYDTNGDGKCDAAACKDVFAIDVNYPIVREVDRLIAADARTIGVDLDIHYLPVGAKGKIAIDPSAHVAIDLSSTTFQSFPNASPLFESQFTGAGIGVQLSPDAPSNETLIGAAPRQLRRWGYSVTDVPNVDVNVADCSSRLGFAQTQCWAGLDRLLMEQIVPIIPFDTSEVIQVVSARVVRYGIDASSFFISPDQFALASTA